MKIAILNTYTSTGGAARAAMRLTSGLIQAGTEVEVLSRSKYPRTTSEDNHKFKLTGWCVGCLDLLPCKFYPKRQAHNFSANWFPGGLKGKLRRSSPDLLHLHWIGDGFVRIETIAKAGTPAVWTIHDSWPFTGGCYLPGECIRYRQACGCCPVLGSNREDDLSRHVWSRKNKAFANLPLTIVAPSRWMAERARSSSLFSERRIEVIPNGIDTNFYKPGNSETARERLNLPLGRDLIVYGANHALQDPNKGFDLLEKALHHFCKRSRNAELVIFGGKQNDRVPHLPLPVHNMGEVQDELSLVDLYRAADVFVLPSRQENLPNVILEAMACGTPCVAFRIGGLPDMIEHQKTGFLATPFDPEDFGRGILWLLSLKEKVEIACKARETICNGFSLEKVVESYRSLYRQMLAI